MRKTSWKPRAEWPTQCTTENHHPLSNPFSATDLHTLSLSWDLFKILACPGAARPHTFALPFTVKATINRLPSVVFPASELPVHISIRGLSHCAVIHISLPVSPPRWELRAAGTRAPAWRRYLFHAGNQRLFAEWTSNLPMCTLCCPLDQGIIIFGPKFIESNGLQCAALAPSPPAPPGSHSPPDVQTWSQKLMGLLFLLSLQCHGNSIA